MEEPTQPPQFRRVKPASELLGPYAIAVWQRHVDVQKLIALFPDDVQQVTGSGP